MNVLALDLSLTATGWAFRDMVNGGVERSGVLSTPKLSGIPRLRHVRELVLGLALDAQLIVIEGYAYGAKGNAILNIAELGGVIRVALTDHGHEYVEVPPASLKMFATGKGNVGKDEMLAAAIRRLGYSGHDHNEADALWLLQMACCARGLELASNEAQRRALAKITWPEAFAA